MLLGLMVATGILLSGLLPVLPAISLTPWLIFFLLLFLLVAGLRYFALRLRLPATGVVSSALLSCGFWLFLPVALGVLWGGVFGQHLLNAQLNPLLEGEDVNVTVSVVGLPVLGDDVLRFEAITLFVSHHDLDIPLDGFPHRLRLSWYGGKTVKPGDVWRLRVRLKRPRGFVNFAGQDYQRWLLSRGIGAVGYVRQELEPMLLAANRYCLDCFRLYLRDQLLAFGQSSADSSRGFSGYNISALLAAMLVGDKSQIPTDERDRFQQMGLSHLLAISGLHIGLSALLGYWLGQLLSRILALLFSCGRCVLWAPGLMSMLIALAYALMAGFGLPAQRALVMVAVVNLALSCGRPVAPMRVLVFALCVCLIFDPLAGFDAGFWLSFTAVACLLVVSQSAKGLVGLLKAQLAITLGLFIPLTLFGIPISLASPLLNIVAVPIVSLLVVPPLLLGASFLPMVPGLADLLWMMAWHVLDWLLWLMECVLNLLQRIDNIIVYLPAQPALLVGACVIVMGIALVGIDWRIKLLSIPLFVAMIAYQPRQGDQTVLTVLDVGQGTAVLLEAGEQVLLYDTGPLLGGSLSAGNLIINPVLHSRAVNALDVVVISHNDSDHRGGFKDVAQVFNINQLYSGEPLEVGLAKPAAISKNCQEAKDWQWRGANGVINFHWLPYLSEPKSSNDWSCVLLLDVGGVRILLPGDIESRRERELVDHMLLREGVDILVAAHHGSKTSSSMAFLQQLHPQVVLISSGYRNRYGHPHKDVIRRYQDIGARVLNTAVSGALQITISPQGDFLIKQARIERKRYWFDEVSE